MRFKELPRAPWCLATAAMAIALLAPARRASGATPQTRMIYARAAEAAECPDETALRREVEARLGYDPFVSWGQGGVIVQVSRKGARYVAQIQVLDAQGISRGVRELSSGPHDCDELFHATALTLAIALRGAAEPHTKEPAPPVIEPPAPAPALPPVVVPSRPPAAEPPAAAKGPEPQETAGAEASASELQWALSARVFGSLGTAPTGSVGGALGGRVRVRALSLGLEARADLPSSHEVPLVGRTLSSFYAAWLIPCVHVRVLALCGLAGAGALVASGRDVTTSSSGVSFRPLLGARASVEWPLGGGVAAKAPLALTAQADLTADLRDTTLDLDGQEAWSTPPLAVSLGVGVLVRLP